MTKITVAKVKPSQGDKSPTIIVDDTGAKMSGFDTGLKKLQPGDIIDVELKPKGNYLNIISFKSLEKAPDGITPYPGSHPGVAASPGKIRSIEDYARASIIADLYKAGILKESDTEVVGLRLWLCQISIGAMVGEAGIPVTKNKTPASPADTDGIKDLGALLTWCANHGKEFNRTWFFKNTSATEEELKNPAKIRDAVIELKANMGW